MRARAESCVRLQPDPSACTRNHVKLSILLNNEPLDTEVEPDVPLLWFLRDRLGLTGSKYGCGKALCGACTVHVGGAAVRSCVTPVASVQGKSVSTIEWVSKNQPEFVEAWQDLNVAQCGFCQPGQIMSASALLAQNSNPSDDEIDRAMSGNICRCGTYMRIRSAIHRVAEGRR